MINLPVVTPWNVRTPRVYRYLKEEFVDDFFQTGRIQLSSFAQFSMCPDEEKGDNREGDHVFYAKGTPHSAMIRASFGHDAYILCFSTILTEDLMNRFGGSAVIEIKNTISFGAAIGRRLSGWTQGFEGFCDYDEGAIERDIGNFSIDQLKENESDSGPSVNKIGQFAMNLADPVVFFRKRTKYQSQSEYRFAWIMGSEISQPLIVECPEARQFCVKKVLSNGQWITPS